ncbi:MAG: hypothetical protein HY737_09225 [Candidatus Omnitrophica bacterium]|nr:hypothetical protein [Candidatus Omnitrophota bacterium]
MRLIEIPHNPNCDATDRVFHELEPPQPVRRIRLERTLGVPEWFEVTGWMADGRRCPAMIQKVDDSGDGVAFLLFGGDGGLRFRPDGSTAPWKLTQPEQWGEPMMMLTTREGCDG